MKNKKIAILLILLVISFMISIIVPMPIYAENQQEAGGGGAKSASQTLEEILQSGNDFITQGQGQQDSGTIDMESSEVKGIIDLLYQLFAGAGLLIATLIGIILGIKFMMSASADEKAKYKHQLIAYAIGVIVIVGAIGIWKVTVQIMNQVDPDEGEYNAVTPGTITEETSGESGLSEYEKANTKNTDPNGSGGGFSEGGGGGQGGSSQNQNAGGGAF